MQFDQPLIEGILVGRPARYVAEVRLADGAEIQVHCANAGRLKGCSEPGSKVYVSKRRNERLRFTHQLEIIYAGKTPVAVHSGRPAAVLTEAMGQGRIKEVAGYAELRGDVAPNRATRVDLVLKGNGLRPCYIKAENVTHVVDGVAFYPDVSMTDPAEQMQELTNLVREGNRVMMFFLCQRADVESLRLADELDPEFCEIFRDTVARGVEVVAYRSRVTHKGIELDEQVTLDIAPLPGNQRR